MRRYLMLAGLVGLVMMLGATEAAAQRGMGRGAGFRNGGGGGGGFGPGMAAKLNLSEQQKAQVQRLRNEMKEDNQPVLDELNALRKQMRQLWASQNPDEDAIMALHAKMDPLRKKLRERKTQFKLDVLELLNQEQRAAFSQLVEKGGCSYGAPGRGNGKGKGNGNGKGQRGGRGMGR